MTSRLLLRLTIPIAGLSILLLAIGGVSAWYIQQLYRESSLELEHYLESSSRANDLEHTLWNIRENLTLFALTGSDRQLATAVLTAWNAKERFAQSESVERSLGGLVQIARVREQYDEFTKALDAVAAQRAPREVQQAEVVRLVRTTLPSVLDEANAYRMLNERRLEYATDRTRMNANRIGYSLWLLALGGAIAGLLGGFGVARALQESIVELSVPIHSAAGKLDEVVGPVRVKSSKQLEDLRTTLDSLALRVGTVVERLQVAQRESLRAEQMAATGQLAAGLAHELRNPLTAMKTLVQAARQQGGGHSLDEQDLAILEEEMTRLSDIIKTFLDFARPPALERRSTAIADVLSATAQLVTPRATQQKIELVTVIPEGLPSINADPDQLRHTLLNLLLNAFDAMPSGGRVILRAQEERATEQDQGWLVIEVADNGPGLPEDLGNRIFEPFISTKEAGTGLGLAISRRIVENHGGTISASAGPEGGAVFTIRLPLTETEASVATVAEHAPSA